VGGRESGKGEKAVRNKAYHHYISWNTYVFNGADIILALRKLCQNVFVVEQTREPGRKVLLLGQVSGLFGRGWMCGCRVRCQCAWDRHGAHCRGVEQLGDWC
jgi:hypothetical protein